MNRCELSLNKQESQNKTPVDQRIKRFLTTELDCNIEIIRPFAGNALTTAGGGFSGPAETHLNAIIGIPNNELRTLSGETLAEKLAVLSKEDYDFLILQIPCDDLNDFCIFIEEGKERLKKRLLEKQRREKFEKILEKIMPFIRFHSSHP